MLYLSIILGLVVSLCLSKPLLNLFKDGGLTVTNYRKEAIPVAIGVAIMTCIIGVSVIFHLINPQNVDYKLLFVYSSVFIIGFLDDVLQDKENKGFKGHFKAFFKGKLTTGFLKAMGIPVILLFYFSWDNYLVILDLVFIALAVNIFNFFDLRPGRCQKVFFLANFLLLPFIQNLTPIYLAVLGITAFTLILDLREQGMLGDAGANLLGVVTGLQLLSLPFSARIVTYGVILLLTVVGEKYSFTKIIQNNSFLNYLDWLGRVKR